VGKVLLHIFLGVVIWIGEIFALVIALASSGRDITSLSHLQPGTSTANAVGSAELVMLAAGVAGWLLFVYLRTSTWVRALIFIGLTGAAVALAVSRVSLLLPRA